MNIVGWTLRLLCKRTRFACILLPAIGICGIAAAEDSGSCWPGFVAAPPFGEQVREIRFACEARVILVAPDVEHFRADRPTRLVIFATPNGNTIEQTLGCRLAAGMDWHFDIQHAAAQVRYWRNRHELENVVLACVQADMRSWPTWRQKYAESSALIRQIMAIIAGQIPAPSPALPPRGREWEGGIALTGHSGGGSFITGYVNSVDEIPATISRIAYLDANYSYSTDEGHGRKFLEWLAAAPHRQLVVLAYDDREIELNGKKVVGPTGGTYRASHRLLDYLREHESIQHDELGEFDRYKCADGRLRILIHPNPQNKILHTRLVGEMNGLVYALAEGTAEESTWGKLGTPRVYGDWVQPAPFDPQEWRPATLAIPPRRDDAPAGSEFAARWTDASAADREAAILSELVRGNVPQFLHRMVEVRCAGETEDGATHELAVRVMPDYLAIGDDDDFLRIPMTPATAQWVADAYGCVLPTRRLVDQIHRQATVQLAPQPLTEDRESLATFAHHHGLIETQLSEHGGRHGQLIAGIKKDVVISNQVPARPGHVAIYGWHYPDGKPIQPLTTVHVATYVDYSHGVRLVDERALLDGRPVRVGEILADEQLHSLLSDEGPIAEAVYAAQVGQ